MSSKQFINKAMKDWDSSDGHDNAQKNRIARLLQDKHLRHYPLFDQTIFINNNDFQWTKTQPQGFISKEELLRQWRPFRPDLLFPLKNLIIEIDGDFHTNTTKGVKQTKLRDQYYEYAGIKLVKFVASELNKMSDEELLQILKLLL